MATRRHPGVRSPPPGAGRHTGRAHGARGLPDAVPAPPGAASTETPESSPQRPCRHPALGPVQRDSHPGSGEAGSPAAWEAGRGRATTRFSAWKDPQLFGGRICPLTRLPTGRGREALSAAANLRPSLATYCQGRAGHATPHPPTKSAVGLGTFGDIAGTGTSAAQRVWLSVMQEFLQGHPAGECGSQDSNPACLTETRLPGRRNLEAMINFSRSVSGKSSLKSFL